MGSVIATNLAIGHGPIVLAEGITVSFAPGRVFGLVGQNGAGKTTLLKVLAGISSPLAGRVDRAPASLSVGYLAQQSDALPNETIAQWLERRTGVSEARQAMESAATALTTGHPEGELYGDALELWLSLGGADFEERVPAALAEVQLNASAEAIVENLSGGQRARAGLAALLLARFDVFFLDEPTNDLDLAGLARLESFVKELAARPAAVVVVSHDRAFLEAVTTDILELDGNERSAAIFGGGYTAYLAERDVARRHAREAFDEYEARKSDLLDRARTTREWASKGVRNSRAEMRKKGADPDKISRKAKADASEQQAGKASRLEQAAARLTEVIEPRKVWKLDYRIADAPRSGSDVITANAAYVSQGDFTLGPVDLQIAYGDRVSITGPNGAGKSTLLALLLGRLAPSSGSVRIGSGVVVGELDQGRITAKDNRTIVEAFLGWYPGSTIADVRTLLAKFGLAGDDVLRPARLLSPGERTRASLARFQFEGVNLLVLDEPTNHLDLPAIEQLESALDGFNGTLLLVSHDRRLLESFRSNRQINVQAGQVSSQTTSSAH